MELNVDDKVIEHILYKAESISPNHEQIGSIFIGICILTSLDEIRRSLLSFDRIDSILDEKLKKIAGAIDDNFGGRI